MKRNLVLSTVAILALAVSKSWSVGAGSYTNQTVDAKAMGMGNAFVATAYNPSAIFFNPGGMTQLDKPMISLGIGPLVPSSDYTNDNGNKHSMEDYSAWVPSFYATMPFKEKFVFGFGINSPYGLETDWSKTGPLRYGATYSKISLLNFNPSVAYEVNEKVSIGGGIVYGIANADMQSQMDMVATNFSVSNNTDYDPTYADASQKLSGDGDGWGYDFGVLYMPLENHRFGFTYRSEIKTKIEGEVEMNGLNGTMAGLFGTSYKTDAETDIRFPESVMLGYAYNPGKWTFALDGEWVNYSTTNDLTITYTKETNASRLGVLKNNDANRDWHTTWNLGMGTNYEFNETWEARAGYYYYPRVIPEKTWDNSVLDAATNGFTMGGSFNRPSFSIDLAYAYILLDKRTIHNDVTAGLQSSINGSYETQAHSLQVTGTYKFGS